MEQTWAGTVTFPEVVKKLLEDRVSSYHVDYLRGEARYYHVDGESIVEKFEHLHPAVANDFNPERLQALIKKVQAGDAKYPEFVNESAAAGCAYYIVYMNGRKVRYFGKDGAEHLEPFPGSN